MTDVCVRERQPSVESHQAGGVCARQPGEIGVGDLSMADDAAQGHVGVVEVVWPEDVARMCAQDSQNFAQILRPGGRSVSQHGAQQGALGDRAGRELILVGDEPVASYAVMHVIRAQQRNQYIAIQ